MVLHCRLLGKHMNQLMKPTEKLVVVYIFFALKMTDPMRLQSTSPGSKRQLSFRVKFNFQHMKSNKNVTVNKYFYLKYGGSNLLCYLVYFPIFMGTFKTSTVFIKSKIFNCEITQSQSVQAKEPRQVFPHPLN